MKTHSDPEQLLRRSLKANALLSSSTGLLAILWSAGLTKILGMEGMASQGVVLLVFAGFVGWTSTRRPVPLVGAAVISLLDLLWVAGVAVLILAETGLTSTGRIVLGVSAIAVLDLALLQIWGMRRARSGRVPQPSAAASKARA